MSCPLCERKVLTELYYEDEDVWIVRDLHNRDYDFRILAVWKEHQACDQLEGWKKERLDLLLNSIACWFDNYDVVKIDRTHFSIPGHCHFQACMELNEKH
ncbi:MAG: hypothetical protein U9O96_00040 [Candidatus Thermoplasmatota archaeon]|nr:hypothetical protein [Candidatus Thermoplasmatota archaeon]